MRTIQTTDCRTPEGTAIGLVDAIISTARVLRRHYAETIIGMPETFQGVLEDLRADEDLQWLFKVGPRHSGDEQDRLRALIRLMLKTAENPTAELLNELGEFSLRDMLNANDFAKEDGATLLFEEVVGALFTVSDGDALRRANDMDETTQADSLAKKPISTAIKLIAAERERQINVEGWTPERDAAHDDDQMAMAAMCYSCPPACELRDVVNRKGQPKSPSEWPWDESWWKPSPDDRVRELAKAGALIAAEIDRLRAQTLHSLQELLGPGYELRYSADRSCDICIEFPGCRPGADGGCGTICTEQRQWCPGMSRHADYRSSEWFEVNTQSPSYSGPQWLKAMASDIKKAVELANAEQEEAAVRHEQESAARRLQTAGSDQ